MTTIPVPRQTLEHALDVFLNSRSLEPVDIDWVKGKRQAMANELRALLAQPEQSCETCINRTPDEFSEECFDCSVYYGSMWEAKNE